MDNKAIRRINLRLLLSEVGGNKAELARRTGVNQAYLTQVDRNKPSSKKRQFEIGDDVARRLAAGMGKPLGWMDYDHRSSSDGGLEPTHVRVLQVRMRRWDQVGGIEGMMTLDGVGVDDGELVNAPPSAGSGSFALRVRGDSMVSAAGGLSFPAESIIVVDPTVEAKPGYPVIVKLPDVEEAVFKILELFDGKRHLKPLNPRYPIAPMPTDARIVGVVISVQLETLPFLQR